MSLVDFMQQLQDQDNVIYSEVPESSIRVIPPEKACTRIIPPESMMPTQQNNTIRLKINKIPINIPNTFESVSQQQVPVNSNKDIMQVQTDIPISNVQMPIPQVYTPQQIINKEPTVNNINIQTNQQTQQTFNMSITEDELFIRSGTESSKKDIWIDYYSKAKNSRKFNPVVDRMKVGRFTITPDNKVLLLPDYDIVGKDPDMVLKEKWF